MASLRAKVYKIQGLVHSGSISHVDQYEHYARYALTHTKESLNVALEKRHLYKESRPLYVVNLEDVKQKYLLWKEHMPSITPFYAVKCNPDKRICEELAALGCGFDCASEAEFRLIGSLKNKVDPSRIIYSHPCKPYSHLKAARSCNVNLLVFDSKYELDKIKDLHPHAKCVLRLEVDNSYSLHPLGTKFGARWNVIPSLLKYAQHLSLNVVGVSFHIGSKVTDSIAFNLALKEARKVFDISADYGFEFTVLDIGGGFPGNWTNEAVTLPEIAETLNQSLPKLFPNAYSKIRVIAEPGRYMVSSCACVITTVIGRRKEVLPSGEKKIVYYLNEGIYGCFNNIIFDDKTPKPLLLSAPKDTRFFKSTFYGPTCDSIDKVLEGITFPLVSPGAKLCFPNMGAYTRAAASEFNGFGRIDVVYLSREEKEHPSQKLKRKAKAKQPVYNIRSTSSSLQDSLVDTIRVSK